MFFRYLKLLENICKKVYFKPQVQLLPLFAENRNKTQIIASLTNEIAQKCDFQCPIMSLPSLLKLNNETIFLNGEKYLHSPIRKSRSYKEKFFDTNYLKIGIKWQGNTLIGAERAINAASYKKLFKIKNSKIYSLQVMDGQEQIKDLENEGIINLGITFKDFSDTASAIDNLDIVICNDTSVGHLAGAMGKKCYILLPKNYDWRWHKDITKCNWYKSVKLYRQLTNWDDVVMQVYNDIVINLK